MMPLAPLIPPYPLPPNPSPEQEETYRRDEEAYEAALRARDEESMWVASVAIAIAGFIVVGGLGGLLFALWSSFGWRGPAYAILAAMVFFAAVVEVKRRMFGDRNGHV